MKRYIVKAHTGRYYQQSSSGQWTPNVNDAYLYQTLNAAENMCLDTYKKAPHMACPTILVVELINAGELLIQESKLKEALNGLAKELKIKELYAQKDRIEDEIYKLERK